MEPTMIDDEFEGLFGDGAELDEQFAEGEEEDDLGLGFERDTCPHCGLPREDREDMPDGRQLVDLVVSPPTGARSYGTRLSALKGKVYAGGCKSANIECPPRTGIEEIVQVDGVGFEYIGGWAKHPGIIADRATRRWKVVESNRRRHRKLQAVPRVGDYLAGFLRNMRAVGLPVQAILSMGGLVCRCISGTDRPSNHSYGHAIDIGGIRLANGVEYLVANHSNPGDLAVLHRTNACLRLSFPLVLDYYYNEAHGNHFHCDTNHLHGYARSVRPGWKFVRKSLGLKIHVKRLWNRELADALRRFAGSPDAVKDRRNLAATLSSLFKREAVGGAS